MPTPWRERGRERGFIFLYFMEASIFFNFSNAFDMLTQRASCAIFLQSFLILFSRFLCPISLNYFSLVVSKYLSLSLLPSFSPYLFVKVDQNENMNFSITEKVSVRIKHRRRFLYSENLSPTSMALKLDGNSEHRCARLHCNRSFDLFRAVG